MRGVIGRKAHDAAEQRTVSAVAVIGLGERAVQGEIHLFKRRRDHLVSQIRDNGCAGGMGAGGDQSYSVPAHQKH